MGNPVIGGPDPTMGPQEASAASGAAPTNPATGGGFLGDLFDRLDGGAPTSPDPSPSDPGTGTSRPGAVSLGAGAVRLPSWDPHRKPFPWVYIGAGVVVAVGVGLVAWAVSR